ncbi:MAG: hypothetical protein WB947_07615 [Thermoplasmata archaeon]
MANAVVVERGPSLFLVPSAAGRPIEYARPAEVGGSPRGRPSPARIPTPLVDAIHSLPDHVGVSAATDRLRKEIAEEVARPVALAILPDLRRARRALPPWDPAEERQFLLATARLELERMLQTPEEILITLTREEERLERAVGREERAAESFLTVAASPLAQYAREWTEVRAALARHHGSLDELVRAHARRVVPNLAAVVGERTAARLVAAAGGVSALARMRAGRIQLLGTRRRPSPERGPRYGLLYRADGMAAVPPGRRGAYARSLGAIAAIAIRADATTRNLISPGLVARRDRRIAQLGTRH